MNRKVYVSPAFECEVVLCDFLMNSADVYDKDGEMIFNSASLFNDI